VGAVANINNRGVHGARMRVKKPSCYSKILTSAVQSEPFGYHISLYQYA
jgi:hypothetical protein